MTKIKVMQLFVFGSKRLEQVLIAFLHIFLVILIGERLSADAFNHLSLFEKHLALWLVAGKRGNYFYDFQQPNGYSRIRLAILPNLVESAVCYTDKSKWFGHYPEVALVIAAPGRGEFFAAKTSHYRTQAVNAGYCRKGIVDTR